MPRVTSQPEDEQAWIEKHHMIAYHTLGLLLGDEEDTKKDPPFVGFADSRIEVTSATALVLPEESGSDTSMSAPDVEVAGHYLSAAAAEFSPETVLSAIPWIDESDGEDIAEDLTEENDEILRVAEEKKRAKRLKVEKQKMEARLREMLLTALDVERDEKFIHRKICAWECGLATVDENNPFDFDGEEKQAEDEEDDARDLGVSVALSRDVLAPVSEDLALFDDASLMNPAERVGDLDEEIEWELREFRRIEAMYYRARLEHCRITSGILPVTSPEWELAERRPRASATLCVEKKPSIAELQDRVRVLNNHVADQERKYSASVLELHALRTNEPHQDQLTLNLVQSRLECFFGGGGVENEDGEWKWSPPDYISVKSAVQMPMIHSIIAVDDSETCEEFVAQAVKRSAVLECVHLSEISDRFGVDAKASTSAGVHGDELKIADATLYITRKY
jgi:hypothetical protein